MCSQGSFILHLSIRDLEVSVMYCMKKLRDAKQKKKCRIKLEPAELNNAGAKEADYLVNDGWLASLREALEENRGVSE